jgi:hypothetical protein
MATTKITTKPRDVLTNQQEEKIKSLPTPASRDIEALIARIEKIRFFKPDGKPAADWMVSYADNWVDAYRSAETALAKSAVIDGKSDSEVWDSVHKTAWKAATNATTASSEERSTFIQTAWAVGDVAQAAALAAADGELWFDINSKIGAGSAVSRDARVMAHLILVADREFEDKGPYLRMVKSMMDVWEKGYGLMGESHGVLYVYCRGRQPGTEQAPIEDALRK